MKIRTHTQPEGSALVVTLLTALVIGITLASYLTLVSNQNVSTMRSLAWNSTVPVLESGVEEALTHIHDRLYNHVGTDITDLSGNGWTQGVDGWYHKTRSIGNANNYEVAIQPVNPPVIVSVGYVPAPLTPSAQLGMILGGLLPPLPVLNPPSSPTGDANTRSISYVSRRIRVNTKGLPRYDKAMAADGQIDLKGNNVQTDSFQSCDPAYSTNGKYDPAKARDNGDIATNAGLVSSVTVGNADIKGHVSTGPGGSVSIGSQGSVGSKAWVESGKSGIEPGFVSDDMNIDFPSVPVPFTAGYTTPIGGLVNGVLYDYVLTSGNYKLGSLSGKVLVTGQANLLVTDSVSFTGQGKIEIAPGATLKLFVSAPSANIGGNGVVNNGGNALNFQYYGLPSNTSLSMSGNAAFTGVIYAPQAALSLGGGGNNNYDFVGGSVTKTAKLNGHFNFHYDECLKQGPAREYVITAWNEI
jgi:hypothetical protein